MSKVASTAPLLFLTQAGLQNAGDRWHFEVFGDSCSFLELHGTALGAPQTL